jgi:hypothetical protein
MIKDGKYTDSRKVKKDKQIKKVTDTKPIIKNEVKPKDTKFNIKDGDNK